MRLHLDNKGNIKYILAGMTFLCLSFFISSCQKDKMGESLEHIVYSPISYTILKPDTFPPITIPADNPQTYDGVQLGRHLFYDPIMSRDSAISCATCHMPSHGFSDSLQLAEGIEGRVGKRSSMSLLNVAYADGNFFWDGRVGTLEEQALLPVETGNEFDHSWPTLIQALKDHQDYPIMFRKAFGIKTKNGITKELATKAIAQFERILISGGNSIHDRVKYKNDLFFEDDQDRGFNLFFAETGDVKHPGCFHCHNVPLFNANDYFNNGLDSVDALEDFVDYGRGEVTGFLNDNGKFRSPSLRNIELTAPYMHDGRFETLEEVLQHYSSGGHPAPNLDPNIKLQRILTAAEQSDIIAFLRTLTDTTYVQNPDILSPFE